MCSPEGVRTLREQTGQIRRTRDKRLVEQQPHGSVGWEARRRMQRRLVWQRRRLRVLARRHGHAVDLRAGGDEEVKDGVLLVDHRPVARGAVPSRWFPRVGPSLI